MGPGNACSPFKHSIKIIEMPGEQDESRQAWVSKGTFEEPRLSELIALYKDIGLEVRLEPFDPATDPGCAMCMRLHPENYKTIYTRTKRC